ncbi:hypothetical protein C5167_044375 [Papaver somniferum]|uniref:No apical meristem-associated C-terminal domain-containing protein n=1 Tax=Papaver somniferum TaxID=3469 RepID=A0A4Y7LAZ4_PAPSO|nr:hypothetical protein C5167_044375 [Papaver somniferum]
MDSTSDDDARHSDLSSTQTNGVNNNGVTENHNSSSTPSVKAQNYHGFLQSNHFSLCPSTHPNFALHRVDAPYPAQQFYGTRLPYQGFMRTSPFFPYDSQNSDASVTTMNTETPNSQKKPRKKVTKNTKAPQPNQHSNSRVTWTMEEDVALTKAWLYVTQDAITGRDQPSDRMWNRIWGVWRDNMVMEAKFLFEGNDKGPFKYEHCWEIMKANPKWCSQQLTLDNSSKKLKVLDGDSFDTGTASVPNNEEEYLDVDGVDRGSGRKKAKENVQKMHDQEAVVDMLSSYKSTLEKQHAINQQNMEWREQMFKKDFELREKSQKLKEETQKSKQKAYKRKEQERILNTNLEKLQPVLRIAYEKMQAQILKEWENEGLFGDEVMNGGADISSI